MKNRIMKTMLMLIMSAMCFLTQTTSSFAYNESEYEVDPEEAFFYLNNADGPNKVPVTMFLLVQDKYVDTDFKTSYEFWCTDGEFNFDVDGDDFTDTEGGLRFVIRSQNSNLYYCETVDGLGELWMMQFTIEPGTYKFAYPSGMNYITILPSSLGSPLYSDGYTEAEKYVVEEGETVQLYGLLGDDDWREGSAPLNYIMDFARTKEDSLAPKSTGEDAVETVQVENDSEKPEEEVSEDASALETAETLDSPAEDEELQVSEEIEAPKEKSGALKFVITGIVLILIIALLFVIKKKDEKSSDKE